VGGAEAEETLLAGEHEAGVAVTAVPGPASSGAKSFTPFVPPTLLTTTLTSGGKGEGASTVRGTSSISSSLLLLPKMPESDRRSAFMLRVDRPADNLWL
jgi:hypothetical protein